ncbi:hypothetical protein Scani_44300 [Streptomyces caniferus]|uniref:Uncharacterized protein n=1 Tax=Streptomyces caniferus TaxID=285557 RepID=A0A640SCH1_9ACTN|nr:hypothetical protein Scani_44300 [Streptomyces caniferus]
MLVPEMEVHDQVAVAFAVDGGAGREAKPQLSPSGRGVGEAGGSRAGLRRITSSADCWTFRTEPPSGRMRKGGGRTRLCVPSKPCDRSGRERSPSAWSLL